MATPTPTPTPSSLTPVPAQLPEVLIAEILKRLPVKTLVQFKCVCKSWHKLLTDPIFTNTHLHFTTPTRIILSRYFKSFLSLPLHPNPNPNPNPIELPLSLNDAHTYYVKGHCNGLLLLIISDGTIILWNPTIARYRTLPTPSNFKETREVLGFGYDSSTNDYKIVRAPSSYCKLMLKDYNPQIEVLSLNSNSWRKLPEAETPPYFIEHSQQSFYLNGAVYWLTLDDFSTLILRFDLAKESFARVPPPRDDIGRNMSWIGVINDSLCVLHSHQRSYFDIWATRDDFNWEKMITVFKTVDPEPCFSYLDYAPLCFVETGELLMSIRRKGLVAYDPNEQCCRRIALLEDARWLQETVYTDSFVFPEEPSEVDQTGSSSGALTSVISQMLLGFSNAFMSRIAYRADSS